MFDMCSFVIVRNVRREKDGQDLDDKARGTREYKLVIVH